MQLRCITPTTFKEVCYKPVHIKRTVNKEKVKEIIDDFMCYHTFVSEVKLDDEDRMNLKNVYKAFEEYIKNNHIKAGVLQRQDRIFLRNDTVPLYFTTGYPKPIVDASKRARMNF